LLLTAVPVNKAVANSHWIYHPPGDSAWDARLEASPFDPMASWCTRHGKSLNCTRAQNVMDKFLEARAAAGAAGGSSSEKVRKLAEAGSIDTESLARELDTLGPIDHAQMQAKYSERWMEFGEELLNGLVRLVDQTRGTMLLGATRQGHHPLFVACKFMESIGDGSAAQKLMEAYTSGTTLPPSNDKSWRRGYTFIGTDSVARFKTSSGTIAPESWLRHHLGENFMARTDHGVTTYGMDHWRISFVLPPVDCITMLDIMDAALDATKNVMGDRREL